MNKYSKITIRLVLMATVSMLLTHLPNMFPSFFGDTLCNGKGDGHWNGHFPICDSPGDVRDHNPCWHWGWAHWMLIIYSIAILVVQIVGLCNKYEK